MGAPNTQYADADLTIYDVIESDEDMAEEIMQGAETARQAAEDCDPFAARLEALHAKIEELKVPGVLESMVLLLFDKAAQVKARAEAVAEKIPAAAEAIRQAGENAAGRHKPLADAVRDAGHTAPAEREYHNE
jgi:septation ring formation regulator EzrA